jgi:phage/plasmid-like protein (TIGR03299 family)
MKMTAEFDCGFSVRQTMWHDPENRWTVDFDIERWDDARLYAGLMWEPILEKVYTPRPVTVGEIEEFEGRGLKVMRLRDVEYSRPDVKYPALVEAEGQHAVVRDDTMDVLATGLTDKFSLITHAEMGEIIETILGRSDNLHFETAGSLKGGAHVWALVRLDEPYTVGGDESQTYPFLVILNRHDGSGKCKAIATDIRVVCWNTWQAAEYQAEAAGTAFSFSHVGDTKGRIEQAKEALSKMRAASGHARELFEELAQVPVNEGQVKTFEELFLPSPRDVGEQCSDRVHGNVLAARGAFDRIYTQSPTTDGVRGNAFGLLQTATEYLDHVRGFRSRESYLGRTLLRPEKVKGAALNLVREVVSAN